MLTGPGVFNHPINVRPSADVHIPSGWPLDESGAMTCLTCHEQGERGQVVSAALRPTPRAESPGSQRFCTACHTDASARTAKSSHWMAMKVAHVRPNNSAGDRETLDDGSRLCLSCHDGVNAGEAENSVSRRAARISFEDASSNHPIGMTYSNQSRSKLKSVSGLPPEVALPGGKVGCVSCHNLYNRERGRLTVPIDGSALCFTCHDLR
ncbi:MAG: hypothetical protein HZB38_10285 [Planctomycetes bacterium]|nr:hypothetical protein [Planctomycetota bacterium]